MVIHKVHEGEGYPHGKVVQSQIQSSKKHSFCSTDKECWSLIKNTDNVRLKSSYFVGIGWSIPNKEVIHVSPKKIDSDSQADCLKMLSEILKDEELSQHCSSLYEIDEVEPLIEITKEDDFLSPLILSHFILLLRKIVRKGLLKGYRSNVANFDSSIRGKILVGDTLRRNHTRGNSHKTYCKFSEFTVDIPENQLLKIALVHAVRAMQEFNLEIPERELAYVLPAFELVSKSRGTPTIIRSKPNPFYSEYKEAHALARLILKRFGYNIRNIDSSVMYKTPPFWVDMSKLFELYALSLLKRRFGNHVLYHVSMSRNELDYLLNSSEIKMVVDAKYKPKYKYTRDINDIRQVSGYTRLKGVYQRLKIDYPKSIDALIIYPDKDGQVNLDEVDLREDPIPAFEGIYKVGIRIPTQPLNEL